MNHSLRDQFLTYVEEEQLFNASDTLLVGCSGGVDSMVLCHLLLKSNIPFEIAHVNYGLRGRASDEDERFVRSYCQNYFIPYNSYKVTTPPDGNIQDWARTIRYKFFHQIKENKNLDAIVTAHHFDDQIETFILNFTRGSGLTGLIGIRSEVGDIKRPFLFARKSHIRAYAETHQLAWREDETNATNYYKRNVVRHQITPVLESLREHDMGMRHSLDHLKSLDNWLRKLFHDKLASFKKPNGEWQIPLANYVTKEQQFELLQLLRLLQFKPDQVQKIASSARNGAKFYSESHIAIIHQGHVRIRERLDKLINEKVICDFDDNFHLAAGTLELSFKKVDGHAIEKSHTRSYFDLAHIKWPLKIRTWQPGDKFYPFGMYGKTKKVSDLLVHLKLSFFEKEETLVLLDADETILWVIGYRRSMSAPVVPQTARCLRVSVVKDEK